MTHLIYMQIVFFPQKSINSGKINNVDEGKVTSKVFFNVKRKLKLSVN